MVLLQNDWHSFKQSKELFQECMGRSTGMNGGKFSNALKEGRHAHGPVKGSFSMQQSVVAYFMPLDPPVEMEGVSKI